jgi:hypothetical protein
MSSLYWYLCIFDKEHDYINKKYNCVKFDTFTTADLYCSENINKYENQTTVIPVCKYIPTLFHKYILNYKIRNIFYKVKIHIIDPTR